MLGSTNLYKARVQAIFLAACSIMLSDFVRPTRLPAGKSSINDTVSMLDLKLLKHFAA